MSEILENCNRMLDHENVYHRINNVEEVVAANVRKIATNKVASAELSALLNQNAQQPRCAVAFAAVEMQLYWRIKGMLALAFLK